MNKKIGLILLFFVTFLLLFSGQPGVNAQGNVRGGVFIGVRVRDTWGIVQSRFTIATDLELTLDVWEKDVFINGWDITVNGFPNAVLLFAGPKAVSVRAWGANIPKWGSVIVNADFWLNRANEKSIEAWWTSNGERKKASPLQAWRIDYPLPDPQNPGQFLHLFCIYNNDTTDYLNVTGLAFNATMNWYEDLTQIIFPSPYPNFTLAPGQSWCTNITTLSPLYGGHIYFRYEVRDSASSGNIIAIEVADHPVTEPPEHIPVGGISVPVDKFGLLAPYIGLASTILVATAATAIYVKRVKPRKKKQ